MLTCRELVQNLSSDYLDGQLNWRQRIGVRFHLLICDHCQRFLQQMKLLRGLLAGQPAAVPAQEAVTNLAERLYHEHQQHHGHRHE